MAQNVELTSEILQVNAISIDPLTLLNPGTKALTASVTTNGGNITGATITTTKMAATITCIGPSSGAVTLATSAGGTFTLTVVNSNVGAGDQCFATVNNAGNSGGNPEIAMIAPSAGALVITVVNSGSVAANVAFSGNLAISYAVFKN